MLPYILNVSAIIFIVSIIIFSYKSDTGFFLSFNVIAAYIAGLLVGPFILISINLLGVLFTDKKPYIIFLILSILYSLTSLLLYLCNKYSFLIYIKESKEMKELLLANLEKEEDFTAIEITKDRVLFFVKDTSLIKENFTYLVSELENKNYKRDVYINTPSGSQRIYKKK